jgi:hypothetical protein
MLYDDFEYKNNHKEKDEFDWKLPPPIDIDTFQFDEIDDYNKKKTPKVLEDQQHDNAAPMLRKKQSSSKRIGGDAYSVRQTKNDHMMKSEDQRNKQLELAQQRKKDRKEDERINRRRASVVSVAGALLHSQDSFVDSEKDLADLPEPPSPKNNYNRRVGIRNIERESDDMKDVYDRYIGERAILEFQHKYKKVIKEMNTYPTEKDIPPDQKESLTPRSLYLRGTIANNTLPLSSLLIRKENEPLSISLPHYGLGDLRLQPFVHIVDTLPGIRTLNLSDNRLTDITLLPLTEKLSAMKNLTHLDLSFNKIDESSKTLQEFLMKADCRLQTLILDGADVDDQECGALATAVAKNTSLETLSLAKNLIGQAELLNVLHPELVTGGEAIGIMLKENKTLTKLDLSWNSIRLDSAIALAESLEVNETLQVLLLAYNSFGDMPSQFLAKALKKNKSLQELDLECNSLNPKAATVLANAISFNETLLKLNINGNTLGKIGAQALVAAIQRSSTETRKLQVSFVNCDCQKDDDNVFSAANPHGTWKINLKEPYGQMVATECFYLANNKAGCRIVRLICNGQTINLEKAYVARADEGKAGQEKKNKLEDFMKFSRQAANLLLAENYEESSVALNKILKLFGFNMNEDQRMTVLKKTFELWKVKAKREGRDVSFGKRMIFSFVNIVFLLFSLYLF